MDEQYWKHRVAEKEQRINELLNQKEQLEFKLLSLEQEKNKEISRLKGEFIELQMKYRELANKPKKEEKEMLAEKVKQATSATIEKETQWWQLKLNEIQTDFKKQIDELNTQIQRLTTEKNKLTTNLYEKTKEFKETEESLTKLKNEWLKYKNIKDLEFITFFNQLQKGLSHRLRDYLGTIQSVAQYCLKKWPRSKLKGHWQVISKQTNNIANLFDELTSIFPQKIEFVNCYVDTVMEDVVTKLEKKCETEKIKLIKLFGKDLPKIQGDVKLLEQAFYQVLLNAIESTAFKNKEISILISYSPENNELVIKITDTGGGIKSEDLENVFLPYFTTKPNKKGLGLFLTLWIIELHRGKISIDSQKGKGVMVTVTLPVKE